MGPTFATCSYREFDSSFGIPVRVTLGAPRFRLGYDLSLRLQQAAPDGAWFRAEPDEFDRRYLEKLERIGAGWFAEWASEHTDGRPLVLLCFEDVSKAACHRSLFARWWQEQTGEEVPELGSNGNHPPRSKITTGPNETPSPETRGAHTTTPPTKSRSATTRTARSTSRGRRGHGEGAVFKRADGLWVGRVERGRDAKGKRLRQTLYARTKTDLLAKLRQAQQDAAHGLPVVDQRQTVAEYLDWWTTTAVPGSVRPSTVENYRQTVRRYITPMVGQVRLAQLTPEHVESIMRRLSERGLSVSTVRYTRAVLRRALGVAERHGRVQRNAAALAEPPKGTGHRIEDAPTPTEVRKIINTAYRRGDRLHALAVLALHLGLRRGELLGLRWECVDVDAGALTVAASLSRVKGRGLVLTAPKTSASVRVVPLVEPCLSAMRDHRKAQAEERLAAAYWDDPGIVFASPVGTWLDPGNVTRWWHDLTTAAGVGRRRMHASRHAAATNMLDAGVALEVVSAILGHSSLAITADVYAKVTQNAKRRALESLASQVTRSV